MIYYSIPPGPKLAGIVRSFWVLEGEASVHQPFTSVCFATECPGMLFHYKGSFTQLDHQTGREKPVFNAGLYGQTEFTKEFVTKSDFGIFGVYLYPHSLAQIFKMPAQHFTNALPDLESLLSKEGSMLEERINSAKHVHQRIEIITNFMLKSVSKNEVHIPGIFESIQNIILSAGAMNISELAEQCSLSRRQFERKFKDYAGFSPKQFCRITRFSAALKSFENQTSLTQLAYHLGYYDQSHFINDFKKFSGTTPGDFLSKHI
jgi:AraC-like DNA-binding protein